MSHPVRKTIKVVLLLVAAYVAFTLVAMLVASGAHAEGLEPGEEPSPSVQALSIAAARVGVAPNAKRAAQDQQTLVPYVRNVLRAHGTKAGALKIINAPNENPSVVGALLRVDPKLGKAKLKHSHEGRVGGPKEPEGEQSEGSSPPPMASASGCYGSVANQWNYYEAGQLVGWIYDRVNGWCGNPGVSITWTGGPSFAHWSWGPFCIGGIGTNWSWDIPYRWIHTAIWGSQGTIYPWGCFTFNGGKAPIRIAASGYYDFYNDYGF